VNSESTFDAAVTWIMIVAIFAGLYFLDRAFQ
jgi:hypothetical protein